MGQKRFIDFLDKNSHSARMHLSSKDKKELRGQAQTLSACMTIGKSGITPGVIETIDIALKKNELIKIRFANSETSVEEQCASILEHTGAELVGVIGNTASMYRPSPEKA